MREGGDGVVASQYRIVLAQRGVDDFAGELRSTVEAATDEIFGQTDLVTYVDRLSDCSPDDHVLLVYLGSSQGAEDLAIDALLGDAIAADLPVLPLVKGGEHMGRLLPRSIRRINAIDWDGRRGEALTALLAMLGLAERDRKVFLSYRRTDSTKLAEQLHTALEQSRYDVFLDRFAVPPGIDFQERLFQDLGDMAFVLLLESQELKSSPWVVDELSYAHGHRIAVRALTLPGVAPDQLVDSIQEPFRLRLAPADIDASGKLKAPVLRRVLEWIEVAHVKELRRRREQLIGSLRQKLSMDGCAYDPVAEWAVLASAPGRRSTLFLVTPRRPRPEDLYALHVVQARAGAVTGPVDAAVVHETEDIAPEHLTLLRWIGEQRQLEPMLLRQCMLRPEPAS